MQCNVGKMDSMFRLILGFIIVMLGVLVHSFLVAVIGIGLLYNGFKRHCYIFELLKINSLNDKIEKNAPTAL